MNDVIIGERAKYLADGIGLADVGEELVAKSGALARALHDACDVDEGNGRRQGALGMEDPRKHLEPGVRDANHARVRLDRREGIVGRQDVVLRQGIEESRFADNWKSDDPDGECHSANAIGVSP